MRPEYPLVEELDVHLLPLQMTFVEGEEGRTYSDFEITPTELYRRMRHARQLPQTSGAILGAAIQTYMALASETDSIVSIHLTSKHSAAYESAVQAAQYVKEGRPGLSIVVIDSKSVSLGTWFLVEEAAQMAQEGASLEQVTERVLAAIPKTHLLATLSTLENVIKGGRVGSLAGYLATLLQIKPILETREGVLVEAGRGRSVAKARQEIIRRVRDLGDRISKVGVLHTNDPGGGAKAVMALREVFSREIPVCDAGAALGVHGGEGALGIAFQEL
jgi:DegV family protein with EDD domain